MIAPFARMLLPVQLSLPCCVIDVQSTSLGPRLQAYCLPRGAGRRIFIDMRRGMVVGGNGVCGEAGVVGGALAQCER